VAANLAGSIARPSRTTTIRAKISNLEAVTCWTVRSGYLDVEFPMERRVSDQPKTKRLYLDGEFIGEIPAVGDQEQLMRSALAFLESKGLKREVTRVGAMFRLAETFAKAALLVYKADLRVEPRHLPSVAPFVVNLAFSIELYLKTLSKLHGVPIIRKHKLLGLLDRLPPAALRQIQQFAAICAGRRNDLPDPDFRKCLAQLNDAFVQWRYPHERERAPGVHSGSAIFVAETLHEACRAHLEADRCHSE
jgi:hypothetical protein